MSTITANLPHENSIATFCLSGPLTEKLKAISEAGFRCVDIFEDDLLQYPGPPSDIGALCKELGLRVSMYQTFRDFEGTSTPEGFEKNMQRYADVTAIVSGAISSTCASPIFLQIIDNLLDDRLQQKFNSMDQVGAELLLICSSCSPTSVSIPSCHMCHRRHQLV